MLRLSRSSNWPAKNVEEHGPDCRRLGFSTAFGDTSDISRHVPKSVAGRSAFGCFVARTSGTDRQLNHGPLMPGVPWGGAAPPGRSPVRFPHSMQSTLGLRLLKAPQRCCISRTTSVRGEPYASCPLRKLPKGWNMLWYTSTPCAFGLRSSRRARL